MRSQRAWGWCWAVGVMLVGAVLAPEELRAAPQGAPQATLTLPEPVTSSRNVVDVEVVGQGTAPNTTAPKETVRKERLAEYRQSGAFVMTAEGPRLAGQRGEPVRSFEVVAERLPEGERAAFLKALNDARAEVGQQPLVWSDELSTYSLEWLVHNSEAYRDAVVGKEIKAARNLPPAGHRPYEGEWAQKHGENLYYSYGPPPVDAGATGLSAVGSWVAEKPAYEMLNLQKPYVIGDEYGKVDAQGRPIVVGHYTQIIWRDTTHVGVSKWKCRTKDISGDGTSGNEVQFEVVIANFAPEGNYLGRSPLNPTDK